MKLCKRKNIKISLGGRIHPSNFDIIDVRGYVISPCWHIEANIKWPPFWRQHFQTRFLAFWLKFLWTFFPMAQLTLIQHSFRWRLDKDPATSHYLDQQWPNLLMHKCATESQWVHTALHYNLSTSWISLVNKYVSPESLMTCYQAMIVDINSLWPSNTIWRQRSGSILAQVMACCLMAPSHYLNQYRLIISKVQWHPY